MKFKLSDYITELLLYSGQYALFYILMNFSMSGFHYFDYFAHTVLIIALFLQTLVLYKFGDRIAIRFFGSLICPFIYTLFEIGEFHEFILNIGHFFFWAFSILIGLLNALKIRSSKRSHFALEFITVFMNIVIFVFIYMYFDISLGDVTADSQLINEYSSSLSVLHLLQEVELFFTDVAHIYITLGGVLLGISLGLSQIKILQLKEKINDLFGKYVDSSIRDKLIENDGIYKEKRNLCVLFCDIRDFTTLSENKESSVVIDSLNQYFSLWESIASEHGGVINKFIGDAIMIIFGLDEGGDQETQAAKCSLKVLDSLDQLNSRLLDQNLIPFNRIGIGIHRGELVLGNVGSETRKEFTVIGDVVNTASRLEYHSKTIGKSLIISNEVYEKLEPKIRKKFMYSDEVSLKGKENNIEVYSLVEE